MKNVCGTVYSATELVMAVTPLLAGGFKEFLRLLNANRVDDLLVGGYAVGLHGYPRAMVDLDLADLDNLP